MLRSTTIEHESVIGDKCILMEGSLVESHCVLAPGTVVTPGRLIPYGQLWAGNPARFVRDLTADEVNRPTGCPDEKIVSKSRPSACCKPVILPVQSFFND